MAAAGRSRPGRDRAWTPARYVPRHRGAGTAGHAVAAARTSGLGARRPVARDRAARARAEAGRGGARAARDRPRALRAGAVLSPGRRHGDCARAHLQGRIGAACRRRQAPSRARALAVEHPACAGRRVRRSHARAPAWRAPRHARAGRRRAGDGVRQSGRRDDDGTPVRTGARARRAQRGAAGSARGRARAGRGDCQPRADLRPPRRPQPRGRAAASRARDAQSDSIPRDDRRGVRHARADPYDPRQLRNGRRFSGAGRRRLRRVWTANEPLVRMVGARPWRAARDASRRARRSGRHGRPDSAGRRAAVRRPAGDADCRRSADGRGTPGRGRAAPGNGSRCARSDHRAGRVGRISAAPGRSARERRQLGGRVPQLRAERDAARPAWRALSGRAQPSRARPPRRANRRAIGRRETSQSGARRLRPARRRARLRRHGRRESTAHDHRLRRVRHVARRCRRCDRPAHCRCRGTTRFTWTRDGVGDARGRVGRLRDCLRPHPRRVPPAAPAATSASSPRWARISIRRAR